MKYSISSSVLALLAVTNVAASHTDRDVGQPPMNKTNRHRFLRATARNIPHPSPSETVAPPTIGNKEEVEEDKLSSDVGVLVKTKETRSEQEAEAAGFKLAPKFDRVPVPYYNDYSPVDDELKPLPYPPNVGRSGARAGHGGWMKDDTTGGYGRYNYFGQLLPPLPGMPPEGDYEPSPNVSGGGGVGALTGHRNWAEYIRPATRRYDDGKETGGGTNIPPTHTDEEGKKLLEVDSALSRSIGYGESGGVTPQPYSYPDGVPYGNGGGGFKPNPYVGPGGHPALGPHIGIENAGEFAVEK
jgi:hypothetical protein